VAGTHHFKRRPYLGLQRLFGSRSTFRWITKSH
jgi:hypothetical protein